MSLWISECNVYLLPGSVMLELDQYVVKLLNFVKVED